MKPKIRLTLVERKGTYGCHRGHRVGDTFDFDTERGMLCLMAMHVALCAEHGTNLTGVSPVTGIYRQV